MSWLDGRLMLDDPSIFIISEFRLVLRFRNQMSRFRRKQTEPQDSTVTTSADQSQLMMVDIKGSVKIHHLGSISAKSALISFECSNSFLNSAKAASNSMSTCTTEIVGLQLS